MFTSTNYPLKQCFSTGWCWPPGGAGTRKLRRALRPKWGALVCISNNMKQHVMSKVNFRAPSLLHNNLLLSQAPPTFGGNICHEPHSHEGGTTHAIYTSSFSLYTPPHTPPSHCFCLVFFGWGRGRMLMTMQKGVCSKRLRTTVLKHVNNLIEG